MKARPRPYHRENLEESLLTVAAKIVASRGADALSLRELGKVANVSRSAPYHYFKDKDELLFRVGERGFERLQRRVTAAAESHTDPIARVRAGFHAYLAFAVEEPHFFNLMFGSALKRSVPTRVVNDKPDYSFSSNAAASAFATMLGAVGALSRNAADGGLLLANAVWAATHGVATLAVGNHLKFAEARQVLDRLLDSLLSQ